MECELSWNGQVVCADGRSFVWRQGAWVQIWPPTGAQALVSGMTYPTREPQKTKKEKSMSELYDPKCEELARHFLGDETGATEDDVRKLSAVLQQAAEDYLRDR